MELEKLKAYLNGKNGATEGTAWGLEHLVYKVGGKLFAVVGWDNDPMTMSLKCDPNEIEEIRKVFDAVRPAPYFNKKHWNQIVLYGSVPEPELLAMIDESYHLVVRGLTRKKREELESISRAGRSVD